MISSKCSDLIAHPSLYSRVDLIDLQSRPLNDLLEDAKEIYNNMKVFEKRCLTEVDRSVYEFVMSMYHLALLKLSTAIEEKPRDQDTKDPFVEFIVGLYTKDEKNALKELEKFSKLDPNVTPPQVLADIIVSEEGEIYSLVKEAVIKNYIDLRKVLKTWENELKIRNYLTHAFINVYNSRFNNIIKAIEHLLNHHPAWLKRLFKEYETALLESAEMRRRFEERMNEVLVNDRAKLEESIRRLEEENSVLRSRIERISIELEMSEEEKKRKEQELAHVRDLYERLYNNYKSLVEEFNKKIAELDEYKRLLEEKERQLENLKKSHEVSQAEREALENEIIRLRQLVSEYEKRVSDYAVLESKLKELESIMKGEMKGNIVRKEEVEYIYHVVSSRVRRLLEQGGVRIYDPREKGFREIKKWDEVEKTSKPISSFATPVLVKSIVFTKYSGILPMTRRKDVVVEYAVLSHIAEDGLKEYDAQPVDISEFTTLWKHKLEEAEREKYYYVLVVISPTGFTKNLVDYVTGGISRWTSIASKYSTVYLVDPLRGNIVFNSYDPVAKSNSFLARLELEEELVEKIVQYMMSKEARVEAAKRNPAVHILTLDDIERLTGVTDKLIIRRALSVLEERGIGKIKKVGESIVFTYSQT